MGSIPGWGRSPDEGRGNPLQHSCLENPWTEEPGGLQSMGLQTVGHDNRVTNAHDISANVLTFLPKSGLQGRQPNPPIDVCIPSVAIWRFYRRKGKLTETCRWKTEGCLESFPRQLQIIFGSISPPPSKQQGSLHDNQLQWGTGPINVLRHSVVSDSLPPRGL